MTQPLPLPPLEHTINQFLTAIQPVFNEKDVDACHALAKTFLQGEGQDLQAKLQDYAQTQVAQGKSWLSDYWLEGYLSGRGIKSTSSNVGFQINFASECTQLTRAAEFIYRVAQTHHDYIQGKIEPLEDGRGNTLSMDGWQVLNGAMRIPKAELDELYYAPNTVNNRHISIFYQGHHYVLNITDEQGVLLPKEAIEFALHNLSATKSSSPFSLVSALPSVEAQSYLDELCINEHNKKLYQMLKDSWFCVSLFASEKNTEELDILTQQSFFPSRAWQYKPFTYQIDLNSSFISVQVEHTGLDGATLQAILDYAFALKLTAATEKKAQARLFDWQITDALATEIQTAVSNANRQVGSLEVRKFSVDYSAIKVKVSHDALIQLSLLYAQLLVFKQLRNTYEAVDTSHYLAGRTECLRPNTHAARHFCEKLITNSASIDDLQAALKAQKAWVIACKSGQGIDRHLLALSKIACHSDDFFSYVQRFIGHDFLSTSTVGRQAPIRRFIFAPTSIDGFGVNYSLDGHHYEYCLIANQHSLNYLDAMEEAIHTGVNKLIKLIIEHH